MQATVNLDLEQHIPLLDGEDEDEARSDSEGSVGDDENGEQEDGAAGETTTHVSRSTQMLIYDTIAEQFNEMFGHMVASVKHKRNALTPIEKLTDDILSRIFLTAIVDERTRRKFDLSHVCSRWRNLFMADARLWTDINLCDYRPQVRECLKRARDAPLDLRYHWSFDNVFWGEDLLDIFEPRAQQIRSLSISFPVSEIGVVGHALVSTPLPLARSVNLCVLHAGWADEVTSAGPFIEELFGNNAPDLRYLRLQKFGLPWTLSQFTELTTIMLDKCYFTNPTPSSDFITILEALPSLRQLSLSECQHLCHTGPPNPERRVRLPSLQVTQLDGLRLSDMVHILSALETPPTMRLAGKLRFGEDDSLTLFSQLDLSAITSLATIRDLQVEIQHNNMISIESVVLTGSSVKSGSNKNLMFTITGDGLPWVTNVFPAVCEPFRFTNLRKLSLTWNQCGWGTPIMMDGGAEPLPVHNAADSLMYFLRQCPDIVSLKLSGWSRADVLEVLSQTEGDNTTSPPCAALHTVHFERSHLTDEGLRNLVLRRPGCAKLRSLTLSSNTHGFKSETVRWLREAIEDVCWDNELNEIVTFDPLIS